MARRVAVSLAANVTGYVKDVQNAARETTELHKKAKAFEGKYTAEAELNAAQAKQRIQELRKQLRDFAKSKSTAEADVDGAKQAAAELASLKQYLEDLDGETYEANVRVSGLQVANSRVAWLRDSLAALGPAAVAGAAAATPAIAAISQGLGATVTAAATLGLAFNGIGDALEKLNEYRLEPTVANFQAMQQAMQQLGPAGQEFVRFLQDLRPKLQELQNTAQAGLFPGLQDGISELMDLLPVFERLVGNTATAMGQLAREAGDALTSPFWRDWFNWFATDAADALLKMGHIIGNVTEGFAGMFKAFDPLADDFMTALQNMSRAFSDWGRQLASSQGFHEFVSYVRDVGPDVWDALTSVANAMSEIVQAAAPVAEVVLPVVEALADALAAIADSPAGPVLIGTAAALATLSRAIAAYNAVKASALVTFLGGVAKRGPRAARGVRMLKGGLMGLGAALAVIGAVESATDDLANAVERANEAMASGSTEQMQQALENLQKEIRDLEQDWQDMHLGGLVSNVRGQLKNLVNLDVKGFIAESPLGMVWRGVQSMVNDTEEEVKELKRELAEPPVSGIARLLNQTLPPAARRSAEAMQLAAQSTEEFTKSLQDLRGALGLTSSIVAYESSLDELARTIKENRGSWAPETSAGQEKLSALIGTVNDAIARYEALKKAGKPEAAVTFIEQTIADLEGLIGKAGVSEKHVRSIIQELKDLSGTKATPKVDLKGERRANDKLNHLRDNALTWADLYPGKIEVRGGRRANSIISHTRANAGSFAQFYLGSLGLRGERRTNRDINKTERNARRYERRYSATLDVNTGPARAAVNRFTSWVNSWDNQTFLETLSPWNQANGGVMDFYARGGVRENHTAQIAPAGAMRVWAEPETGGEAYIPLASSKRQRSLDVWAEVGERLGALRSYAEGGLSSPMFPASTSAASPASVSVDIDYDRLASALASQRPIYVSESVSPEATARSVSRQMAWA